jgi:ankyrin repeat protein
MTGDNGESSVSLATRANMIMKHGESAVSFGTRFANTENCLKVLIDAGVDINVQDNRGISPIYCGIHKSSELP